MSRYKTATPMYLTELQPPFYFAGVGDIHGHFAELAEVIAGVRDDGWPEPAFLLAAGDVEAIRNPAELAEVHTPQKYRKLGSFTEVMAGTIQLPPLFFTGGNHEPWGALDAAGAGEWGPNTWFLGRRNISNIGGLVVANLSGIWNERVSQRSEERRRTARDRCYYVTDEIKWLERQGQGERPHILLTHDWPTGVGVNKNGEPAGDPNINHLIDTLHPQFVICGHMHHRQDRILGNTEVTALDHLRGGRRAIELYHFDGEQVTACGVSSSATLHPTGRRR